MAKKARSEGKARQAQKLDERLHAELRRHSKAKTPVAKISKLMKRTAGALRQQALKLASALVIGAKARQPVRKNLRPARQAATAAAPNDRLAISQS